MDWVSFAGGVLMGGATDFVSNYSFMYPCVADGAKLVETAYFTYIYVNRYL